MATTETQTESLSQQFSRRDKPFEKFDKFNPKLTGILIYNHCFALFCFSLILRGEFAWQMLVFKLIMTLMTGISVTAGAHRLWSHRSYKASLPLQILLMYFNTLTCQGPIYTWACWHRLHHKLSDTDGDPHNIGRGFFYAQIGWVAMYDHEKFTRNMEGQIDVSDLERDRVVMWQHRNFNWWVVTAYLTQMIIPYLLGLETSILYLYAINELMLVLVMHFSGFVNSFAHLWGGKPFDKAIRPTESLPVALGGANWRWNLRENGGSGKIRRYSFPINLKDDILVMTSFIPSWGRLTCFIVQFPFTTQTFQYEANTRLFTHYHCKFKRESITYILGDLIDSTFENNKCRV
ncbi:unnamed protein product [Allacma fusca]|uniref:Uncharacterized protein n=1 Tax=Allacma fusca TaxID=39272 RepID=A0A8J2PQP8_9HEXA|nr:unnamed protein product [Allacma fusca]